MRIKNWKKIRDRQIGRNTSIIYQNKNITLELFTDSMWGKTNCMNVIIRNKKISSYTSALGKTIDVKFCDTREQARAYAIKYMKAHPRG